MSLNDDLEKLRQKTLESFPADIREKLLKQDQLLFSNYVESRVIKPGSKVPEVMFRDKDLKAIYLKDLTAGKNLVLSFFRGAWCPYCNLELNALSGVYDEILDRNAQIVAVSPELYEFSEGAVREQNIRVPILTDLSNKVADKFGLVFELPEQYREIYRRLNINLNILNGEKNWTLPVPATFIISKDRIVVSSYVNVDYTKRMEPADILTQLDLLLVNPGKA